MSVWLANLDSLRYRLYVETFALLHGCHVSACKCKQQHCWQILLLAAFIWQLVWRALLLYMS